MRDTPLVSVCMTAYNHEAFIAQAIDGVLMQKTDFPIELVIVDDCSTDNTLAICRRFQEARRHVVKIYSNEFNLGVMPNCVKALKLCRGKYIALCEGDDFWIDEDKLSTQIRFLEDHPEYSGSCTAADIFEERTRSWKKQTRYDGHPPEFDVNTTDLLNDFFIYTATFVFRNCLFDPEVLRKYSFGDRFIQLLTSYEGKIRFFKGSSAVYRIHPGSAMHVCIPADPKKFYQDHFNFLTYFDEYTSFEFRNAVAKKQKYLQNLMRLSDRSTGTFRKSVAGLRHLFDRRTERSINEVRNVLTLAFPEVRHTAKRLLGK